MALPTPPRSGMLLSFNDEFDRPVLNVDPTHPTYMTTFPWGARSQPQFYQKQLFLDPDHVTPSGVRTGLNPFSFAPDPSEPGDGIMTITASRTPSNLRDVIAADYVSGHINTASSFEFRYGYVEMRAKVPAGNGLLSTFYALRSDKGTLGEIDINEYVGATPKAFYQTVHYTDPGGAFVKDKTVRAAVENLSLDFHTYGVDWTPSRITFYLDGVRMGQMATPASVSGPMYLLADLSVGGTFPGQPDATTPFPARYAIDFLRVWQDPSSFAVRSLNGTGAAETLSGGDGNDVLRGQAGADTLLGSAGNDRMAGEEGNDRLLGNTGRDTISGGMGADTLEGGGGDDLVFAGPGDLPYERPNGGFDTVVTNAGTSTMRAHVDAQVFAGPGATSILGTSWANLLVGATGADTLNGAGGNDTLRGAAGNDSLTGALGNDVLVGGPGNDTMVGGGGSDVLVFHRTPVPATELVRDFRPGLDDLDLRALGIATFAQASLATSQDGAGNAVIKAAGETITLLGVHKAALAASDFVLGTAPAATAPTAIVLSDTHVAENGVAGTEVAMLHAMDPDPAQAFTYALTNSAGGLFALEGATLVTTRPLDFEAAPTHTVAIRATNEAGLSVTKAMLLQVDDEPEGSAPALPASEGTAGADTLVGGAGKDALYGLGGNDRLDGLGGNDRADGGDGNDIMLGGAGNDVLLGGPGTDRLIGGPGDDRLAGQGGDDRFVFDTGSGRDVVSFTPGTASGDLVQFSHGFTSFAAVMDAATQVSAATSPFGGSFSGVIIHAPSGDEIWMSGIQRSALTAGDFVFG
jgi:Ca2+-binding RTX toxin-like protein